MVSMENKPRTVEEYIDRFPPETQQRLQKIRALAKECAPEAVEKISYDMPAFFLNDALIWYGAYKNFISLYPRQPEMDISIQGLSAYKGSKGSIHFPLNQPMPYDLIRQIVLFRLAQINQAPPRY